MACVRASHIVLGTRRACHHLYHRTRSRHVLRSHCCERNGSDNNSTAVTAVPSLYVVPATSHSSGMHRNASLLTFQLASEPVQAIGKPGSKLLLIPARAKLKMGDSCVAKGYPSSRASRSTDSSIYLRCQKYRKGIYSTNGSNCWVFPPRYRGPEEVDIVQAQMQSDAHIRTYLVNMYCGKHAHSNNSCANP